MEEFNTIRVETGDDIAVITLNRPERLNAWTGEMGRELDAAISALNDDPAVGANRGHGCRSGILCGSGHPRQFQIADGCTGR